MITFIFDMDDTLYLRHEPLLRTCSECFPALKDLPTEEFYQVRKKHSDFSFNEVIAERMTAKEMYIYRTRETFREYGLLLSDEEALAFEECYLKVLKTIRLRPEMEQLLDYLSRRQVPMGILTNGPEERQLGKMKALGLERFIPEERCLVSGALGVEKPDPDIFYIAEGLLHLCPEETWYIGDSYEADMAGAHKAGWHTIWLPLQPTAEKKEAAELTASSCEMLFNLIKELLG